jgi:butyrate kinase
LNLAKEQQVRVFQHKTPQLDEVLNQKAGLLGISGISGDMREILAAIKTGNERAKLALDIYIHRLRSGIRAMIAVLGGLMLSYSPQESAKTHPKFAPRRVTILRSLA